ncbi:DMT family transporter [Allorhizocola rhizosphaerae]|uniref:DMT family transporter n=1 Tax=Allorhizocola rhizosphaerae TaxID=1872709 RepID=UPI000E3BB784|nr:DMT family transporter [Allorhizocola rhizosphaerae]
MLPILLAGASALIWGTADFCGGKAVQLQRGHALSVTVFSQLSAAPMIALFLLVVPGRFGVSAVAWGAAAGVAGLFGIVLLYQSLASGAMAVVAPTTAVTAAVVPMIGGLVLGERPGALPITGALCAVVAIGFVSMGASGGPKTTSARVFGLALLSGVMFGLFFLLLARAGESAGMWPLAMARFAALPVGLLLLRYSRLGGPLLLRGRVAWLAVVAGVLDITANGFYLIAVYGGDISILAPIASLYPASTVLLALVVNKERLRPVQMAGLGLAAASLVLAAA